MVLGRYMSMSAGSSIELFSHLDMAFVTTILRLFLRSLLLVIGLESSFPIGQIPTLRNFEEMIGRQDQFCQLRKAGAYSLQQ